MENLVTTGVKAKITLEKACVLIKRLKSLVTEVVASMLMLKSPPALAVYWLCTI